MKAMKVARPPVLQKCVLAVALGAVGHAHAIRIGDNPEVVVNWDNTFTYNLGVRTLKPDPKIVNDVNLSGSDTKFRDRGDIVGNRFSVLSEFDVTVRDKFGARVTASAWKDFAYDKEFFAASNPSGVYSSYTQRFYREGGELGDAFVFANFNAGTKPVSVKLGRLNIQWGNVVFNGPHAISYAQTGSDAIKAVASPGLSVKELAFPRLQAAGQVQLTDEVSLQGQYFFEHRPSRLPEGGTFDGGQDFLFLGATRIGTGPITRGVDNLPKDSNKNFGVAVRWAPPDLGATMGFYVRQFDDVTPWVLRPQSGSPTPLQYHLVYAQKERLIGLSLDMDINTVSTGFELSFRKNTALNSELVQTANGEGARGELLSFVANAAYTLPRTAFWDTGSLVGELAGMHLTSVTENPLAYKGYRSAGYGCLNGNAPVLHDSPKRYGCSTRNALVLSLSLSPQWLQVAPGLDLTLPLVFTYGLRGNAPGVGTRAEGQKIFGVGVQGLYRQAHRFTLNYTGSRVPTIEDNRVGLGGQPIYRSGTSSGNYPLNDRDRLSFTYQTTF